jgi:hypothetical protein
MSFNRHLKKISAVHSDRTNHAYLNPHCVCLVTSQPPAGILYVRALHKTQNTHTIIYPSHSLVHSYFGENSYSLVHSLFNWPRITPPTWNHSIKISGGKLKILLVKTQKTTNSLRYAWIMCDGCVCLCVCVCVTDRKQPFKIRTRTIHKGTDNLHISCAVPGDFSPNLSDTKTYERILTLQAQKLYGSLFKIQELVELRQAYLESRVCVCVCVSVRLSKTCS